MALLLTINEDFLSQSVVVLLLFYIEVLCWCLDRWFVVFLLLASLTFLLGVTITPASNGTRSLVRLQMIQIGPQNRCKYEVDLNMGAQRYNGLLYYLQRKTDAPYCMPFELLSKIYGHIQFSIAWFFENGKLGMCKLL